jgi:hypothetical protein
VVRNGGNVVRNGGNVGQPGLHDFLYSQSWEFRKPGDKNQVTGRCEKIDFPYNPGFSTLMQNVCRRLSDRL